jgi:hypothetical protein
MFLISTSCYAVTAQIDLMKIQFCTEIECFLFWSQSKLYPNDTVVETKLHEHIQLTGNHLRYVTDISWSNLHSTSNSCGNRYTFLISQVHIVSYKSYHLICLYIIHVPIHNSNIYQWCATIKTRFKMLLASY